MQHNLFAFDISKEKVTKATTTKEGLENLKTIYKLLTQKEPAFKLNSELKNSLIDVILQFKNETRI